MTSTALSLMLVLLMAFFTNNESSNICDGLKDGKEGKIGGFYWRCKGGAVKALGCESSDSKMIIQPQDKDNIDLGMSLKCIPKTAMGSGCQMPGSSTIYDLNKPIISHDGIRWECTDKGFVTTPNRPYSTGKDECQYNEIFTLKPGKCAYIESTESATNAGNTGYDQVSQETFIVECIEEGQNPSMPKEILIRKIEDAEKKSRRCEKWSISSFN